ncbi:MAG TPA: triose-phosphate isomerase [Acidobacteriota bacterium]|nr:triose-phosphate isomerase [Acidobacteriota bacterium]HND18753.1 triose-phosphate isomerase [Acidobacteriota bacterium]HNG94547.1 triose-phosphate isomerase [Acidobacteriota bacterium]HNH81726.1 triose-phosphate isomerase [Acidobacteriota bacterium]HNJ44048.1 triose-phosphate isomerase [Acidobacteriota bacterium]
MSNRKPIIAGNWKMFKTVSESVATALDLKSKTFNANHCEVVIAPVFTSLKTVADRLEGSHIKVAGQDVAAEGPEGAFTGEISAEMLADAGCTHVIIGHSERRQYYHETNDRVARKVQRALAVGLTPILCIGETLAQREAGEAEKVVTEQLIEGTATLTAPDLFRIVAAYEPVWAIGTGHAATPDTAQAMHALVRSVLSEKFGTEAAQQLRILYGGSVKPENIAEYMEQPDIDGALVGGASLKADSFARIVFYQQ